MKSSRWRPLIFLIVTAGLVAAFLYYIYINADKYSDLLRISVMQVIILLGLSLAFPLINSVMNIYLFQSMGAEISYRDAFLLTAASTLANQLPISGGIISKGFYLKRRYGISYTKSFSVALALFFCFIAVNGLIGVIILLYWIFFRGIFVPPALLIGFVSMMSCLVVFWLPVDRIRMPGKIQKWVHEAVQGWTIISKSPALLLRLVGLQLSLIFLGVVRYWLSFHMLSQEITLSEAALFANASILAQLVSIAPGDLGIREVIVGTIASLMRFDAGASIVAVGLDRLVSTPAILLLGGISTFILGRQIFDLPGKNDESNPIQ